ncbi:hypothetical protein MPSEU_000110200 [Mayamaea pseudoterrestris]|nr:hypothetical protein MPSEU_000110200 [Mayamaea pseudoterrestris]
MPQYINQIESSQFVLESLPSLRSVTPNSSFDSDDSQFSKMRERSESIPIVPSKHMRTSSEIDAEKLVADDRDNVMFQRIVHGLLKTQSTTRDCRWRHANNMSLLNIYNARNDENKSDSLQSRFPIPKQLQLFRQTTLCDVIRHEDDEHDDDNDESMPFALEM